MAKSTANPPPNKMPTTEKQAEYLQQFYYESFGDRDWDAYKYDEHVFLKRNIGFALFGEPDNENNVQNTSILDKTTGYKKSQNNQINEIYAAIMKNHYLEDRNIILVRTIFNCCVLKNKKKALFVEPVFVVKKCQIDKEHDGTQKAKLCTLFIDSHARVYQSWQFYLENNKLPECLMIFPKNGHYMGKVINYKTEEVKVIIEKADSPACTIGSKILNSFDILNTVASVGVSAVFIAAAIPAVTVAPVVMTGAAVAGGAVGVYSFGRSTHTLVDRSQHSQSIGLDNAESRWCWLNTTVGALGATTSAATGLLTRTASRGAEIGQTARIAFNTLNGANIIGSAANLGLSSYHFIDKLVNDECPSPFEIFQLASSVLFFHLSVVNFRTASTIISETQSTTIQNYEKTLRNNRHKKIFKKAQNEDRRINRNAANTEIIKCIDNINDPDNFFAGLEELNKQFKQKDAQYKTTSDQKVQIIRYIIDPSEFAREMLPIAYDALKSMPLPTFDAKNNFITKCCENLLASPVVLKIMKEVLSNKIDIDTMTLLLQKYSDDMIKKFFDILAAFLREIIESDCLKDFKRLHQFVSVPVGGLQFLINHIETKVKAKKIDLKLFLETLFDANGAVNAQFITNLKDTFQSWIREKINILQRGNAANTIDIRNKEKRKMKCEKCSGHFYETK